MSARVCPAMELYLVRHGPVVPVAATAAAFWPLSAGGREAVRSLAQEPRFAAWTHLLTSPEDKARETAQILADHLRIPVQVDDRLREVQLTTGFLSGEEFRARVLAYLSGVPDADFEPRAAAMARALAAVRAHRAPGAWAVVSHGRLLALLAETLVERVTAPHVWSRMAFPDWARIDLPQRELVRPFAGACLPGSLS